MRWFYSVALSATVLSCAATAAAQTPAPPAKTNVAPADIPTPVVNLWYAGIVTGAAGAKKGGAAAGGEAGVRAWRTVDVSLEVGWFQNAANSRPLGAAATLAGFLQSTYGKSSTSTVRVPITYGTLNGRWVFESARKYRPYGVLGLGGARVVRKPTFTLDGADITGTLGQYGVALGADLTGHSSHPAVTLGVGVLIPYKKWYGDVGYRLTTVMTTGQSTKVNRFNVGFGARF